MRARRRLHRAAAWASLTLASIAGFSGCGEGPFTAPPSFTAIPEALCEGRSQELQLSADVPPGATLSWSFSPPVLEFASGDEHTPTVVVQVSAERPQIVTLQVQEPPLSPVEARSILPLTRTSPIPCNPACAEGEVCVRMNHARICVDDFICTSSEACGPCLQCRSDDEGVGRCVGEG